MQPQRFSGLERCFDPQTVRHFDATGVGAGWRGLEVGGRGRLNGPVAGGAPRITSDLVRDLHDRLLVGVVEG